MTRASIAMRRRRPRIQCPVVTSALVGLALFASLRSAVAQNPTVSAADLVKDPGRYIDQTITLHNAFCYKATHGYECRTEAPLRISIDKMPAGPAKTTIDNDCGQLDGLELSPDCSFTLQMVPTETTTMEGDYIRNGQQVSGQITVVTVTVEAAKKE
jgi:hypothetical protein